MDPDGYYSIQQNDDGSYERVPENADPNAFNMERVDAVFMNEKWMQQQMADKTINPNEILLTDEIREECAEMAKIALNNEDVIADIANRSDKIEYGVYFNSEKIEVPSFQLNEEPVTPFVSYEVQENTFPVFTFQIKTIPDVSELSEGNEKHVDIKGPRKENEVHGHPSGVAILSIGDFNHYDFYHSRRNMFVVGTDSGQIAVANRRIEKFGLDQLPLGYISLDNKQPILYKK
jgi:hypothetical protein